MERMIRRFIHGCETFSPTELEELVEFDIPDMPSGGPYDNADTAFCIDVGTGTDDRDDAGEWVEF